MANRTIVVKGRGIRKELNAGGVINPGHLIKMAADGDAEVHNGAGKTAMATFACENELFGLGVTDAYAVGDRVLYEHLVPGQEVYGRVAAAAAAIAVGDFLESDGTGCLRKVATSAATAQDARNSVVGQALEAVDNSGGGAEVFILVAII